MKIPAFTRTIRFKLTLWYLGLFIIFSYALIGGINIAIQYIDPASRQDVGLWQEMHEQELSIVVARLQMYSLIAFGIVPLLGFVGGYFFTGRMLKPVSKVASTAARISSTNLKERINYLGPNDEIKRLADTFDAMLERLDNAFESQKQFIQDASHELRTPIAICQTNIEVAEMEGKITDSDCKRIISVVKQNLERMTLLSDQLLLLTEENQGALDWQAVDMNTVIAEIVDEVSAKITLAGINLELELSPDETMVKGDALYLKYAVSNLVANAIKYNRHGGMVKISTWMQESRVFVEVQDNGIGISSADQPYIFDRFYRVDKSRSRSQGGNGLGLAIVKKIVEVHSGTISVESALGEGSTFRIALPKYLSA